MFLKKHKYLFFLSVLSLAIFLLNMIWIGLDSRPPHWDMGRHLWTSVQYYEILGRHEIIPFIQSYFYYPPLLYWLTAAFYLFFGNSITTAVSVNIIFIIMFTFSVFFLARRYFEDKLSLIVAIVASSYPIVVTQFKEYQLDAPLMAICALFLAIAVRRPLKSYHRTILLGIVIGFGMLLKWTFVVFIFFPMILMITEYMIEKKGEFKLRLFDLFKHLSLMLLVAYAIASPWYVANIQQIRIDFRQNGVAQALIEGDPAVWSLESNIWYIKNLFLNQVHVIWGVIFIVGLFWILKSRDLIVKYRYPLIFIFGSILILTFLPNKDARYTMAILPAVAVISLSWLPFIRKSRLRIWTMGIIGFVSIFTWLNVSFGIPLLRNISLMGYPVICNGGYIIGNPSGESWHQEEVAEITSRTENRSVRYVSMDTIWFNNWTWSYLTAKYDLDNNSTNPDIIAIRSDKPPQKPEGYNSIREYKLPDGTQLNIYEKSE